MDVDMISATFVSALDRVWVFGSMELIPMLAGLWSAAGLLWTRSLVGVDLGIDCGLFAAAWVVSEEKFSVRLLFEAGGMLSETG